MSWRDRAVPASSGWRSRATPENDPGILETMSNAADRITETMPYMAGLMSPGLGTAYKQAELMNQASGRLGEAVTEVAGRGQVPENIPLVGGKRFPQATGPLAAGIGALASVASNPQSYVNPELGYSSKLGPARGKPGIAAQIKKMRTGVEASAFEQLRRDPGAFFSRADRSKLGSAIGTAKEKAGINLGVTDDIGSLTPENIAKARSPMAAAKQAQDAVIGKLELSNLPVVESGSKTGQPHAVYAYTDDFGPGGTKRAVYNVYGDPQHPAIKQRGFGSSVPKEELDKLGIPVVGRQAGSDKYLAVSPDEASNALDGINQRLSKIERSEGAGSKSFQQWSAIKSHFQDMLEQVAPEVKAANKDFSRVALRDKFMQPFPVNQSGTFSKINAAGFIPLAATGGAVMGGGVGGAIGAGLAVAGRSPFVAGLGTAARGLIDKAVDPALSRSVNVGSPKAGLVGMVSSDQRRERLRELIERMKRRKQ